MADRYNLLIDSTACMAYNTPTASLNLPTACMADSYNPLIDSTACMAYNSPTASLTQSQRVWPAATKTSDI